MVISMVISNGRKSKHHQPRLQFKIASTERYQLCKLAPQKSCLHHLGWNKLLGCTLRPSRRFSDVLSWKSLVTYTCHGGMGSKGFFSIPTDISWKKSPNPQSWPHLQYAQFCWYPCANYGLNPQIYGFGVTCWGPNDPISMNTTWI